MNYSYSYRPAYSDGQLYNVFRTFDRDGSGTIDFRELKNLLAASGEYPNNPRAFELLSRNDFNRDGHLDFNEFLFMYRQYRISYWGRY